MSRDDIERLLKKISEDPDSKLFVALAEEYRKAGMADEAISTLVQGLDKQPHYLSARVSLGNIYMSKGLLNDAKNEFEKVIASIPENLYVHKKLAEIYRELGETEKTVNELNIVLNLNPADEWAISSLALIERESREAREEKGEGEFTELLPAPVDSVIEEQERGAAESPSGIFPVEKEAPLEEPSGDKDVLVESGEEEVKAPFDPLMRAEDFIRRGNYREALETYKAILSGDPDNRVVLQRIAELKVLFKMLGKDQEAHVIKLESFLEKIRKRRDKFGSTL